MLRKLAPIAAAGVLAIAAATAAPGHAASSGWTINRTGSQYRSLVMSGCVKQPTTRTAVKVACDPSGSTATLRYRFTSDRPFSTAYAHVQLDWIDRLDLYSVEVPIERPSPTVAVVVLHIAGPNAAKLDAITLHVGA